MSPNSRVQIVGTLLSCSPRLHPRSPGLKRSFSLVPARCLVQRLEFNKKNSSLLPRFPVMATAMGMRRSRTWSLAWHSNPEVFEDLQVAARETSLVPVSMYHNSFWLNPLIGGGLALHESPPSAPRGEVPVSIEYAPNGPFDLLLGESSPQVAVLPTALHAEFMPSQIRPEVPRSSPDRA